MSLKFIDISNWQAGLDVPTVVRNGGLGAVVFKATEGLSFTDRSCDGFARQCLANDIPFGFYHFGRNNGATAEADFFRSKTRGYEGRGVPILDWEDGQSIAWVNEFVERYHALTGVWPWVYSNSRLFNQGTVNENCARWIAGYPKSGVTDINYGLSNPMPYKVNNGTVCAWQFSSSVIIPGYGGRLDGDVFYGDAAAWNAYAGKSESEDEVTDQDKKDIAYQVWAYMNKSVSKVDAYQRQTDAHYQLTRTDNAGHDNPAGHDLYGRVNIIEHNLSLVMRALGIEDSYRSVRPSGSGPRFDDEVKGIKPLVQ